jgi:predicted nucleic acid-binding protein
VKVLFDTSVLVAAIVQSHVRHAEALPWLRRAKGGEVEFLVAAHTLAELYSVLTALPIRPRIVPGIAWRLVQENVESSATLVPLTVSDYSMTLRRISALGLSGGIVYDALIARAAEVSGAERLLTLNTADFRRAWPEGESILLSP